MRRQHTHHHEQVHQTYARPERAVHGVDDRDKYVDDRDQYVAGLEAMRPVMDCDSPPNKATKGKNMVGLSASPHQLAIQDLTMNVDPAKPARPGAAGCVMGWRGW